MNREDKDIEDKDIEDYLYKIYDNIIHWYTVADDKANSIITIATFLLGFITISVFVGNNTSDNLQGDDYSTFTNSLKYLLIIFFITAISSIGLAIFVLWSRLHVNLALFKRNFDSYYIQQKPLNQQFNVLKLFFGDIANKYPSNENYKKNAGENFLTELKKVYNSKTLLDALSEEVVILSVNTTKKFFYVNIAYLLLLISITLLSFFIVLKFLA